MPAGAGIFCWGIAVSPPGGGRDYLISTERDSPLASLRLGRRMKLLVWFVPWAGESQFKEWVMNWGLIRSMTVI